MTRGLRSQTFAPNEISIVHATQRCIRRSFLTGFDSLTKRDYSSRRDWIQQRAEALASVFAIDVLAYAMLSNHLHLVLRNRPDIVALWSDQEVALRWLKVFPGKRLDEFLGNPTQEQVEALVQQPERIQVLRERLSDISWFMRCLSEPIARRANREDQCTGRFWEGRFKAQRITDEAGLLACSMYVDLNPIRAAMAATPEQSRHTSAYDRIAALQGEVILSAAHRIDPSPSKPVLKKVPEHQTSPPSLDETGQTQESQEFQSPPAAHPARSPVPFENRIPRDGWLSPLQLEVDPADPSSPQVSHTGVRASDLGFLSMGVQDYLKLLDWTGRQGRSGKSGKIPEELEPILSRLGIDGGMWSDLVWNFKRYFGRRVGSPQSLKSQTPGRWFKGQKAAAHCFT
jgi:hypothetical protein